MRVAHASGTGVGCPGCIDIGIYVNAVLNRDSDEMKRIEKEHGIRGGGVSMEEQGIIFYRL